MRLRCPSSKYLGVARLGNYKWIINDRGYANVVETSSSNTTNYTNNTISSADHDHVYGLVYTLTPTDESLLDKNEGVPIAYQKEHLRTSFWSSDHGSWVDVTKPATAEMEMLVYIDRNRTSEDEPKKEYIYRMNRGIDDAVKMGVPREYVDSVMRRFIPAEPDEGDMEVGQGKKREEMEKALQQAKRFEDESGVFERTD